jgi:hypothetical protein
MLFMPVPELAPKTATIGPADTLYSLDELVYWLLSF